VERAHEGKPDPLDQPAQRSRARVGDKESKGGGEKRYLEFNFHRVRREGAITHVSWRSPTSRRASALAAQLKGAQDSAQSQMDAFLSILHVDPNQLSSFLDDSDVAFKMINATLRDPARDSASFRRKIDGPVPPDPQHQGRGFGHRPGFDGNPSARARERSRRAA
jgi:hypothetical protein